MDNSNYLYIVSVLTFLVGDSKCTQPGPAPTIYTGSSLGTQLEQDQLQKRMSVSKETCIINCCT